MYTHRNILKMVAGALLLVSLPAGAQVLGGSLGGAANGSLGGRLGGAEIGGAATAAGDASFDASGAFDAARHQARRAGGKARDMGGEAAVAARSRVDATRETAAASVETAQSVSARAGHRAARSATRASSSVEQYGAAQASSQPSGDLAIGGFSGARAEQRAAGHSISAEGAAGSQTTANRSELRSDTYGGARLSAKKDEPAPAETPAQ
jgi:hypothetical protein